MASALPASVVAAFESGGFVTRLEVCAAALQHLEAYANKDHMPFAAFTPFVISLRKLFDESALLLVGLIGIEADKYNEKISYKDQTDVAELMSKVESDIDKD